MHRHFFGDYRNLIQFEILIGGARRRQQRRRRLRNFRFWKSWVQQQVAAVLQITEIQAEWTAISDRRPDRFFLVCAISQPNLPCASQPHAAIQFVDGVQFDVLFQFFRHDINAAARGESNSVPRDHALCESSRPPRQASPRAMRRDCFHKRGAATSTRDASSAKPQATRVLVSYLQPSGHTGEIRRQATCVASSPELVRDAEKGARLYRD